MPELPDREQLLAKCDHLEALLSQTISESERRGRELHALMKGAKAVLEHKSFAQSARAIFDHCRNLIGATSGYVALLNEDGSENEVLFLEAGGLPCDVDPELPMPIRGLRAEAYRENRTVFHNDFMHSPWVGFMPAGHVRLTNVMFAPMTLAGKTVGVIGLANKKGGFDNNDAVMAAGFGELAAIALENSRHIDHREKIEKEYQKLILELQDALAKVKKLSGLLPICSWCKKIRNDQGYWIQLENYLREHSEAVFSHSICPKCRDEIFPEIKKPSESSSQ